MLTRSHITKFINARIAKLQKHMRKWLAKLPDADTLDNLTHLPDPLRELVLMLRLNRPAATTLMLWPLLWGFFLVPSPNWWAVPGAIALGLCLRMAMSVYDDMADQNIELSDPELRRKLPQLSPLAISAMLVLAIAAIWLAWALGGSTLFLLIFWIILAAAHPYMYHLTWLPQLYTGIVLGGWAALLGQAAAGGLGLEAVFLFPAGILWVAGIESLRAEMKQTQDAASGTKSIALVLGELRIPFINSCFVLSLLLLASAAMVQGERTIYVLAMIVAQFLLYPIFGARTITAKADAWRLYRRTAYAGAIMALGLALA